MTFARGLVKNEKQDRHREINERRLRGEFGNLKEVLATNLATNRGLENVIDEIKHQIVKLPHIGSPLPKTWVRVRDFLEGDSRNNISLEEYLNVCKANGFYELKDAFQLSGYLHDIGVFLHFQDDPLLKKTVILKPKWGTDAVYKVLDNKTVIRNLGRFDREDLKNIWNAPEYENMHDELLQLMMKFKLCYRIPGREDAYIAPQLLTENQPAYTWEFENNLLLRYTYDFMPKGILTQFIVAMNHFIANLDNQFLVWKSGVVLFRDQTLAEVVENYGKREIFVRIMGAHQKDLMSIIMYELDKIHSSYRRLKYGKLIPCNCGECKTKSEPYFYRFEILQKFIEDEQDQIQCQQSYRMVNVKGLVESVVNDRPIDRFEEEKLSHPHSINITIGNNSNVGNIILDSVTQSYFNKIATSDIPADLKEKLQSLIQAVNTIKEELPPYMANQTAEDLKSLVNEATLSNPNPKWCKISIDGLVKAAENLGKIGKPVIELASQVLLLLHR
ncbi:MAG: hypothetical protein HS124_10055 [Anaerolineales bacterium]|nr:hypothetical protein [Anaerolineales bacterium]